MKNRTLIACLVLGLLCQSTVSLAQGGLRQAVQNAFDTLKYIAQEPNASLEFDNSRQLNTESRKQGRIIVNLRQIQYILNHVDEIYSKDVIRLIVGHELGHQVQYRYYTNQQFSPVLNECQADILAGFFLFQISLQEFYKENPLLHENDPRISKLDSHFARVVLAGVSAIFDLGDDYTKDNTHPRNEQRRLAVRDGFTYGGFWIVDAAHNLPQLSNTIHLQAYQEGEKLKKILNYLPADNVLTWSYRHAKNIVHFQQENSKNIVVYSDWKWDTTRTNPYCSYTHKIKNIGDKIVSVNFEDQIYTALRTDPSNSLYWDIVSNNSYALALQPGETKSITGRLKWDATIDLEPYFVKIGDKGSLYSCSTIIHKEEDISSYMPAAFDDVHAPSLDAVLDVILSERDKFTSYIDGIGNVYFDDSFDNIDYPSRLKVPVANETRIHFDRRNNAYSMYVNLYVGAYRDVALTRINSILEAMKKIAPRNQYEIITDESDNKVWEVYDEGRGRVGQISLDKVKKSHIYSAIFQINQR